MAADWIVVGNGIAGAALSYELQKAGFSVLVLDAVPFPTADSTAATRYSYGGIAYWAGTTDLMRQLCRAGIAKHRQLSVELDADTQFRELDLLLTVAADRDPEQIATTYAQVEIAPTLLDPATACEREPLLNRAAVSGVLQFPHASVSPEATVAAYNQAFLRLGGKIEIAPVIDWVQQSQGVVTPTATYTANQIAICTGAMTRKLLQTAGFQSRLYFTHAELIETDPVALRLQSIVMPAELQRFEMEAKAAASDRIWDEPGQEVTPAILDAGAVQLADGRLRIGQFSRTLTDLEQQVDAAASEAAIRQAIGQVLPALQHIPGRWCSSRVAFSGDRLPLVGAIPGASIHLFTGFSNPFAILPALAQRFAEAATGQSDPLLDQLTPARFT